MKAMIWAAVTVTLWATTAWAAEQTLIGAVSDSLCGVSHKGMSTKMSDRECTQLCASKGAQYVLVADGRVYKLMNHDADLKAHAGHTVKLTGDVKGDTIKVSKIEMRNASK